MAAPALPPPHLCGIALVEASDEGRRVTYDDLQRPLRQIRRSGASAALPYIEQVIPHLQQMPTTEEMGPALASIKPPLLYCIENSILYAGIEYTTALGMFDRVLIVSVDRKIGAVEAQMLLRRMYEHAREAYQKAQQYVPEKIVAWPLSVPMPGEADTPAQLTDWIIKLANLHPFIQLELAKGIGVSPLSMSHQFHSW